MDKKVGALWCIAWACGAGAGFVVRTALGDGEDGPRDSVENVAEAKGDDGSWKEGEVKPPPRETLEEIVGNHTSTRLPRMTLWLLDANSEEIGELWRALKDEAGFETKSYDLIMVHWMEADPRGALAEVRGTKFEHVAWWAWGRADPEVALEAALLEAPGHADSVLRAIGQFHSDLAVFLMEKHPEALSWTSVEGIGAGLAREEPERALEFLRNRGHAGKEELERWVREDPEMALAWVKKNISPNSDSDLQNVLRKLVVGNPERVEEWLGQIPTGKMNRLMAKEYVQHLCGEDLEKAVQFAQSVEGVRSGLELMAVVGDRLMMEDVQRSIDLLEEVRRSAEESGAVEGVDKVLSGMNYVDQWTGRLIAVDPVGVVEMFEGISVEGDRTLMFEAMGVWIKQDEVGYAEWLHGREPGPVLDRGATELSRRLIDGYSSLGTPEADFESALEWAAVIGDEVQRGGQLRRVVYQWTERDPEGAAVYLGNLPEGDPARAEYERRIDR